MAAEKLAPLIVIVGQTASGKSDLGMFLAQKFNGEIICADSRTIYKGMDIGTAKPNKQDQAKIKHYLLDIIKPNQRYTVARFKSDAQKAIEEAHNRGKLPILIGGSGLYINSVIFDYKFSDSCIPQDTINPRHKSKEATSIKNQLRANTLVFGLSPDKNILKKRIEERTNKMIQRGLINETRKLIEVYGSSLEAYKGSAYFRAIKYINGDINKQELIQEIIDSDLKLSKKQKTWFKRNQDIKWIQDRNEAQQIIVDWITQTL